MLDRIKKRQFDGFKEFVQNMETTGSTTRGHIFTAGVLEDPVFMSYVMKNIRTIDDFLNLSGDDIETVLASQEQMMGIFAKSIFGSADSKIMLLESSIPRLMSKLKDELSYLKEVTPQEKTAAQYYVLKHARKFQNEEKIQGFTWDLPPMDLFYPKTNKDGPGKILFENGVLAAEGEYLKNRRVGPWRHNYDTGKILAEGEYNDGLKSGVWVFYYGHGGLKAQGRYYNDVRNGIWKEWDRNGVMIEVEYKEGVRKEI